MSDRPKCPACPVAGSGVRCVVQDTGAVGVCGRCDPSGPGYDPRFPESTRRLSLQWAGDWSEPALAATPPVTAPDRSAAIHDARLGRFVRACPHRGAVGDCRGTARCGLGLRGTAACGHVTPADCKRLCGASLWAASRGLPAPGSASLRSASGEW